MQPWNVQYVDTLDKKVHLRRGGADIAIFPYTLDDKGHLVVNSLNLRIIPKDKSYVVQPMNGR